MQQCVAQCIGIYQPGLLKFIYSEEATKFCEISTIYLTNLRWRFLKHLWPSQNIWTLSNKILGNTERYIIIWMESLMNYKWKSYDSKKVLISLGNWVRWKLPDTSKRASSWILDQLVISYLDSNPPILRWRS